MKNMILVPKQELSFATYLTADFADYADQEEKQSA